MMVVRFGGTVGGGLVVDGVVAAVNGGGTVGNGLEHPYALFQKAVSQSLGSLLDKSDQSMMSGTKDLNMF